MSCVLHYVTMTVNEHALPQTSVVWHYRAGNLDVMRAQELGVPPGRAYGELKAGESVLNTGKPDREMQCANEAICGSV